MRQYIRFKESEEDAWTILTDAQHHRVVFNGASECNGAEKLLQVNPDIWQYEFVDADADA